MSPSQEPLTQSEIWDDSALVDSWNEALEEYKKYHSLHRNGGNVEDLLKSNQATSDAKNGTEEPPEPPGLNDDPAVSEMRKEATNGRQEDGTSISQHSHPLGGAPGPQGLLGSVRDEGLKRLLMSWYYAGYYTGLYEGQQDRSQQRESEQR
ncbi:hypothetical protein GGR54DRAFT_634689 [Hypoxylon sp. NC1633]|nr:hypothetical protein GGR54DRAFT_634689 [Hypoxylon sp. NC1633]